MTTLHLTERQRDFLAALFTAAVDLARDSGDAYTPYTASGLLDDLIDVVYSESAATIDDIGRLLG